MRLFISLILLNVLVVLGFAFFFFFFFLILIFPSTIVSSKFMDELYIQLVLSSFI